MQLNSRQQEILNLLYEASKLSVSKLASGLYVTEMTIRRDLAAMQKGGFLKRYHGGAILIPDQKEMPLSQRLMFDEDEKKALAKKCVQFLKDDMIVFIGRSKNCQ